ncbi:MAG TPA: hypothetical protein VHI78_03515 [Bacteroidales bacterium]|nr:hypothetical protein [Bacteroidales bacterium]
MFLLLFAGLKTSAQKTVKPGNHIAFFDSVDRRISYLQKQVDNLKQTRDVKYLNFQRELDHTLFVKKLNELILDENLDMAKDLVDEKIKKSEFRRDQASVKYYYEYQEHVYSLIKDQRMYYQALFKKGNYLRKQYEAWIAPGTISAYKKTQRMILLALKYAKENNLAETVASLETYKSQTDALLFDAESQYDLSVLTNDAKSFDKIFLPLVESDSIQGIYEAEKLLGACVNYGKLTGSSLNGEFFGKKEMLVTSAMSDLLDRQGREKELARFTDQSVIAYFDTINPCGVFKWHDQIIVIDEFIPASSMENVKKGEAIIHADKMLATYLQKNKLCRSLDEIKFGYSFIIPFKSNPDKSSFYFNKSSQKWQFIACYTLVVSPTYTSSVSKFMPPLFFENEMNTAQNLPD